MYAYPVFLVVFNVWRGITHYRLDGKIDQSETNMGNSLLKVTTYLFYFKNTSIEFRVNFI